MIKGTDSNAVCTLLPCQRVRFALRIFSFKHKIFSAKCTVTANVSCVAIKCTNVETYRKVIIKNLKTWKI